MVFLTFADLHDMIKDSLNTETIKKLSIKSREDFARKLLPKEMYILCRSATYSCSDIVLSTGEIKDEKELSEMVQTVNSQSRTTMNYFYKNENAKVRYEEMAKLLLKKKPTTDTHYTYSDCPYRLHILKVWKSILTAISSDEREILYSTLQESIEYITKTHSNVSLRFQDLLSNSLEECLTSLILIASTISYFENDDDSAETKVLRLMFLPNNTEATQDIQDINGLKEAARQKATELLEKITDNILRISVNKADNSRCYGVCMDILSLGFLEDPYLLGKANYILYLCYKNPPYAGNENTTADRYLYESYRYGYPEAIAEVSAISEQNLTFHAKSATSSIDGICIVNCDNSYTQLYLQTKPSNWEKKYFENNIFTQVNSAKHKKYLFFSDDHKKNFTDTMKLLDAIRINEAYYLVDEIEIYIRCREEIYGSLIDTAQNHMSGHTVKIYLLDDEKFAAQYLLSHHPVFYPIRSFTEKSTRHTIPLLNFVVIGSDECAEWLVREASWLMTFLPNEVQTKITIIAPEAEKLHTSIVTKCPGLRKDNRAVANLFKEKVICDIDVMTKKIDSCELESTIDTLYSTESYLYFAISCEDDAKNLEISIRIREQLIRNAILNSSDSVAAIATTKDKLFNLPPIAFRCRNSDISELSSHLVISNINHGDRWYNNYALIPFGSDSTRYTWDSLDGGLIQKYALCVHMEYNDIDHKYPLYDENNSYQKARKAAIDSYYSRQYNKDSSTAVALSLPYRLFSMYQHNRRLAFPSWNILDEHAYYNEKELATFVNDAIRFSDLADDNAVIVRLSEWEQLRWSRYMLARGWMPVSTSQTKIYVDSEYTKHQLYIAKLHPGICDFEKLKTVEQELGKSFQQYNIRNLKNTYLILETKWLEKDREQEPIEQEK